MNIIKMMIICVVLTTSYTTVLENSPNYSCAEPNAKAISIIENFIVEEKFSQERASTGLDNVSLEDIKPLDALSDSENICSVLNVKYEMFLDPEGDIYSYAYYFTIDDKYAAVFTPRLPDDASEEEVMVSGLSMLYILDGNLNQIGGVAGFFSRPHLHNRSRADALRRRPGGRSSVQC